MHHLFTGLALTLFSVGLHANELRATSETHANKRTPDVSNAWFKPTLIEDNDAKCDQLLLDTQTKFFTSSSFSAAYGVKGYGYTQTSTILDWQTLGGSNLSTLSAYGKTYYLSNFTQPGCGGACNTNQSIVATSPFPKLKDYKLLTELAKESPPADSGNYLIAQDGQLPPYLFIPATQHKRSSTLLVYTLAEEGKWRSACTISFAPNEEQKLQNNDYGKTHTSIKHLNNTLNALSQGAGSCGSMKTHWRWKNQLQDEFENILFRPWGFTQRTWTSQNSYGDYDKTVENFEKWALTGAYEFKSYTAYNNQLVKTVDDVSRFYQKHFGWSKEKADNTAQEAITTVVSRGFGFYQYDPQFSDGEEDLRKLILNKAAITKIKAVKFNIDEIDNQNNSWNNTPAAYESILNIAINYPDALDYLLTRGLNPNSKNAFGKTPLMYAAQNNNIDSAKILLEHGASTIAVTTQPDDSCFYTLKTLNVTPLHYAVRYASPELIQLLLNNGAPTFIKTKKGRIEESPLDWFHRYTNTDSREINTNISKESIPLLENKLKLPNKELLAATTKQHVIKAEEDYRNGRVDEAYRSLILALQIQPTNERALSDMSLIAIKAGALGEALFSSTQLVEQSTNNSLVANAWFNIGLACEIHKARDNYSPAHFNGKYYCRSSLLSPFLQAYITKQSSARMEKVLGLFRDGTIESCSLEQDTGIKYDIHFANRGRENVLYIVHPTSEKIDPTQIFWEHATSNNKTQRNNRVHPELESTHTLGIYSISVFASNQQVLFPVHFNGFSCESRSSVAQKTRIQ